MKTTYDCLQCQHRFAIEVTEDESASMLVADRRDACPRCTQRVGTGTVSCQGCGTSFELGFPHWHAHCDLSGGDCPECGKRTVSPCVC